MRSRFSCTLYVCSRYKPPLLQRLQAEVECGELPNAASSLHRFWTRLLDEDDPAYRAKTLEEPADLEEGCLFRPGGRLA